MKRERQTLFVFLFLEQVPFDNNASERAIRNVKVKQKISGQFKKVQAAQNFAKIRSVIDTTIKNGMNVILTLNLIAKFEFLFNDWLVTKKDKIEAEYTLRDINKPLGISEYRLTEIIPENLKTQLPSVEGLENKLIKKIKKN